MGRIKTPNYADENDVYIETGIGKNVVARVGDITDKEVTDLVNSYLKSAEAKVKDLLQLPHISVREVHIGTGGDDEFQLGPEDEDFFIDYDPENCVESVKWCYMSRRRKKRPYPKGCDEFSDNRNDWDSTGYTQPSNEATIKQAGEYAMLFDWSGGVGIARYPDVSNDHYLNQNIDMFDYMGFRVRSDTNDVDLTIRMYDEDGNYNEATYNIKKKGMWYLAMLYLNEDFSTVVNWENVSLYWFTITPDRACKIYFDNLNLNDGWMFTAPSGKVVIMRKSANKPLAEGYAFCVTYTWDPFLVNVPQNIRSATAQLAGAKLLSYLIGIRQGYIGFEAENLQLIPEKEHMYARRGSLLALAKENLASYGYGWSGTVV